jgi:hypothetical protein
LADHEVKPGVEEVRGIADDVGHSRVFRREAVDGDYIAPSLSEGVSYDRGGITHGQHAGSTILGSINRLFDSFRELV